MRNILLGVIALAVVAIAAVLIIDRVDREHSDEWHTAYDKVKTEAEDFCSLAGNLAEDDPDFKACVEDHTEIQIEEWEEKNPERVWE